MILPLPALLAVTLIVLSVMFAGFAGPPASRQRPVLAWLLFAVGFGGLVLAGWLLYARHTKLDSLLAAASACFLALSARLLRAPPADEATLDPGSGPGEPPPEPPQPQPQPQAPREPWDWGDFDRARDLWGGPGDREGAGRRDGG